MLRNHAKKDHKRLFRAAVSQRSNADFLGWIPLCRKLYTQPQATLLQYPMNFLDLVDWCKSFHILTPLHPIIDEDVISDLLARLKNSKADIDVNKVASVGFIKCNCSRYMNYSWCLHVCVWAYHKEIITGVPQGCKPRTTDLIAVPVAGRPAGAARGGALTRK